jgi:hypothetical protein
MQLAAMLLALAAFVALDAPVWLANSMFGALVLFGLTLIALMEGRRPAAGLEKP